MQVAREPGRRRRRQWDMTNEGILDGGGLPTGTRTGPQIGSLTRKKRAHYVGAGASYGWTTPLVYGCFADKYVLQASDQQPMVQPLLTADRILQKARH